MGTVIVSPGRISGLEMCNLASSLCRRRFLLVPLFLRVFFSSCSRDSAPEANARSIDDGPLPVETLSLLFEPRSLSFISRDKSPCYRVIFLLGIGLRLPVGIFVGVSSTDTQIPLRAMFEMLVKYILIDDLFFLFFWCKIVCKRTMYRTDENL